MTSEAVTSGTSPPDVGTWVRRTRPNDPSARPPLIRYAGRTRLTIRGAAWEPMTNPIAEGSDSRPASNGDSPATSWRYWATKRKYPTATKIARKLTVSAALNVGRRNRPRSIIGSASRR